jgi:hypothetical protein
VMVYLDPRFREMHQTLRKHRIRTRVIEHLSPRLEEVTMVYLFRVLIYKFPLEDKENLINRNPKDESSSSAAERLVMISSDWCRHFEPHEIHVILRPPSSSRSAVQLSIIT